MSWALASWTVSATWVPAMRLARSCPCRHRAPGRPENRIRDDGHQYFGLKLRSHRCTQTRNPAGLDRGRQRLDAHRDPSRSASHPAATNARRASSTFRCAYASLVVAIDA